MKYVFFLSLYAAFAIECPAQTMQFYTGEKIEDFDKTPIRLIDQDSLNLYAFRYREPDYFLDVYEKQGLKRVSSIKIPLPPKSNLQYDLEYLFIRKDTFQICYSYFDKTELAEKLEMVTFNEAGSQIGGARLIDSSGGNNQRKAESFSVINRKKFNEFLSFGYKTIKDTSYINIDHFDYSGNKKNSQYFLYNNSGYTVHSSIDDDCNLYHLTRSKLGNRKVNWSIKIYSPQSDQAQIIGLQQPSADKIFLSNFFRSYTDSKGRINFFSPYTLKPLSVNAEGLYLVQIDAKTHALIKENVIPFRAQTRDSNDENNVSMSSCIPVAVLQMNNNLTRIVFESRLITTTSMYAIQVGKEYDIGNIITVDLDSNNVVTEIHNIQKQQHTNTLNYKFTGFAILKNDDESFFIYNELPGNLQRDPDKMKKVNSSKIDETAVIYTTLDGGKVVRKILIDKGENSGIDAILPGSYFSAKGKNEIYVLRKIKSDVYLTKIFLK
ncbi:MAG: hypothetical protein ABJA90_06625 [Ginsengibacter sp.]